MRSLKTYLWVVLCGCSICCQVGLSHAQTWPSELWHDGKIVLLQGDTLRGLVKYDLNHDLVQFANGDKSADAFTSRKVLFFEIFDATVKRYRRFYTLPYETTGAYKAPIFFELLAEGKLTLLAREFLEYKTVSSPYYMGSYSRVVLSHKYFLLKENGGIVEFDGTKNDLLHEMHDRNKEVEKLIKKEHLRFGEKEDMVRIVSYYNSLFQI
jgi:hypothetical protein